MAAHQAPLSLGFSRQEHRSGLPFPSPMHESEKWKWSRSVVSDSSWPHGLQPTRLLRPWDFPGKSTGVGCRCLLQGLSTGGCRSSHSPLQIILCGVYQHHSWRDPILLSLVTKSGITTLPVYKRRNPSTGPTLGALLLVPELEAQEARCGLLYVLHQGTGSGEQRSLS